MKCKATKKHSLFWKKNKAVGLVLSILLVFGITTQLRAQMFSVGDQGPRFNTPQAEVYLGLEPLTTEYVGPPQPEGGAFAFEGPIIRLGYNSASFDLFMGTGGEITGINEHSYFDVGGNIDFGITIVRSKSITVQLPFRIASRYTNITGEQAFGISSLNRFQFGSLTGGAGARFVARPKNDIRIELAAVPSYGFSFASGGFFGGSLGSVAAMGRLYFDRLFDNIGLSLGYDYDLRNYDIDDDVYDYKMTGHSIELGITF